MDTQSIAKAAAAKLDADRNERIAAVETLAESAKRLDRARKELVSAEQDHLQSYRDAVKLGWTYSDIKDFGIEVPSKNLGGRPRKQKTTGTRTRMEVRPLPVSEQHGPTNFGGTNGPVKDSDS